MSKTPEKPLTKWHCDVCGELIENVKDGYVIWKPVEGYGFKIIHKVRCDQRDHLSSKALGEFLGTEGLTYLLSHLTDGPIQQRMRRGSAQDLPNLDQFADFMRRVQVPFYEEARRLFGTQRVIDDFSDANEYMPYCSDRLERMIKSQKDDE
ncbi:MAG: hypothetical protein RR818_12840 [Citrobacter sp.]